MGVPGFLKWLRDRGNDIIVDQISKKKISQVLIDLNSFIHEAAQEIYGYGGKEGVKDPSHEKIIRRVVKKVEDILLSYNADEYVIAIDGVPTLSKVSQQRKRRFDAVQIKDWSNVFISPNHKFMDELYKELYKNFANVNYARNILGKMVPSSFTTSKKNTLLKKLSERKKEKFLKDYKNVVISSHLERGEGEHKIMKMINRETNGIILLLGTDADMVFLSVIINSADIYIKYKDKYISKTAFVKFLSNKYKLKNMQDFILVSYLCGNDFIPAVEDCKNIKFSLTKCLEIYASMGQKIVESSINWEVLKIFFYKIIENSDSFYGERYDSQNLNSVTNSEKGKNTFNELIHLRHMDILRSEVYSEETDPIYIRPTRPDICFSWLVGLKWFLNTYLGNINNDWYYPFNTSPMIRELVDYMEGFFTKSKTEERSEIISEEATKDMYKLSRKQHYKLIVPSKYLKTINEDLLDYYPTDMTKQEGEYLMCILPLSRIFE